MRGLRSCAGSPSRGTGRRPDRAARRRPGSAPAARLVRAVQRDGPRRAPRHQVRRRATARRAARGGRRAPVGADRRGHGPRHARPRPRRAGTHAGLRPGRAHRPRRRPPPRPAVRPAARPRARHDRPVRPRSTATERPTSPAPSLAAPERAERTLVGRWVLLVDDVVTTGATLAACADALERAGALGTSAITVARER